MDSGTLRLILIVAGIILLLGIYYFGQKKLKEAKNQAREWQDLLPDEGPREQEPAWDSPQETESERFEQELEQELEQLDEAVAESQHETTPEIERAEKPLDPSTQQELFGEDKPEMSTIENCDLPQKILQVIVVSHAEPFAGEAILKVAEECGLQHGDMQIFHHYDNHSKQTLFSMASVVEPGNFPLKEIAQLSTPGLALFAQLPAAKPGLEIYDEMINTAKKLAEKLNGELMDETHSALSKQTIEHTRGEILEHARQVKLASKRV